MVRRQFIRVIFILNEGICVMLAERSHVANIDGSFYNHLKFVYIF